MYMKELFVGAALLLGVLVGYKAISDQMDSVRVRAALSEFSKPRIYTNDEIHDYINRTQKDLEAQAKARANGTN